jgi:hypothetical protein
LNHKWYIFFYLCSFKLLDFYLYPFIFRQTWILVNVWYLGLYCNLLNPILVITFIVPKKLGINISVMSRNFKTLTWQI